MIRAGIAGVGWWGRTLVESVQGVSESIRFTCGVTRRLQPGLAEFAGTHGLRMVTSYEEMLADPDIDAVVLATPHSQHVPGVLAAAAAHKHVYCEKPLAFSLAEAERVAAAVSSGEVCLTVGYNRRCHPEMAGLRERIRRGELGTLLHVESTMTFPNALALRPDQWRAQAAEVPCGGLAPMGVHAIDAMIDLFGEVTSVFCRSVRRAVQVDTDDTTSVLLEMKNGMTGYLGLVTATAGGFSFQVFGTGGRVRLEGMTHTATATSHERRSRLFGTCTYQPLQGGQEVWQAGEFDVTRAALESFAVAAMTGAAPPIPLEQIVHGVAVTEAIVASASARRPVEVASLRAGLSGAGQP